MAKTFACVACVALSALAVHGAIDADKVPTPGRMLTGTKYCSANCSVAQEGLYYM